MTAISPPAFETTFLALTKLLLHPNTKSEKMRATSVIVTFLATALARPSDDTDTDLAPGAPEDELKTMKEEQYSRFEEGLSFCHEQKDGWHCLHPSWGHSLHGSFPSIVACIDKCEDKEKDAQHRSQRQKERDQTKRRNEGLEHCQKFHDGWHCVEPPYEILKWRQKRDALISSTIANSIQTKAGVV
ncbi:hypothetical protein XA68_17289 [Ophiocordyceps unilateralis]|uniref:Uncharacterized protein n=1 Tax=Ophiocordyceps unilateralis TaxID=268505 RepID=A0A2A9PSD4_OPHUN|nr:hypothetical protein XA68_17289 [Ophiocordyceps unilateralis]